jgi:hypothetical protein
MKVVKWLLIILVVVLIAVRLAAPTLIKNKVNAQLKTLPEYTGHVEDVDLALWRGAFGLQDLSLKHKDETTALTIKNFETRVHWMPLFKKMVVADVKVESPRIRMLVEKPVKAAKETTEKAKDVQKDVEAKTGKTLPDLLATIFPFRIDRLQVTDGSLRLREKGQDIDKEIAKDKARDEDSKEGDQKDPGLEFRVTDFNVDVQNLTNTTKDKKSPMAKGKVSAKIMDKGSMLMNLQVNPLTKHPTFNFDFQVNKFNLKDINPLLRWQAGVDVEKGTFEMFAEAAAADGGFEGYVKPFIEDLDVVNLKKDKNPIKVVKEAVVGAVAAVFQNEKEQVATRIPFKGRFDSPDVGIWSAIIEVLRNAFIQALIPSLDQEVSIKEVKKKF